MRDLLQVEESPATTLGYGGGVEVGQFIGTDEASDVASERLEVAPRAFFEIGRRNLFGKNRSVNLFTRISLRPDTSPDAGESSTAGYGFSEYRVLGTFREPRVFGTAADAFLTATMARWGPSATSTPRVSAGAIRFSARSCSAGDRRRRPATRRSALCDCGSRHSRRHRARRATR
jgi:hypothetical protein